MRKPRNAQYKIKAYYVENNTTKVFYCKERKVKNLTNELGQSMPLSNGERVLETDSKLDFQMNQQIRIGEEILRVQDFQGTLIDTDLNARRGVPRYITTLVVR
jgi:hypothetical protein